MSLVSTTSPVGGRGDASTDSGSENAASPPNSNSGNQYPCVTARLLTPAQPGGRGSPRLCPPGSGSAMVASSHTSKGRPSWLVMIPEDAPKWLLWQPFPHISAGRGRASQAARGLPLSRGGSAKDTAAATSSTTAGSSTEACLGWGGEPMYARARTTSGDAA